MLYPQRTLVQFPKHTWQLITVYNDSSGGSVLFWPLWVLHVHDEHICKQNFDNATSLSDVIHMILFLFFLF